MLFVNSRAEVVVICSSSRSRGGGKEGRQSDKKVPGTVRPRPRYYREFSNTRNWDNLYVFRFDDTQPRFPDYYQPAAGVMKLLKMEQKCRWFQEFYRIYFSRLQKISFCS